MLNVYKTVLAGISNPLTRLAFRITALRVAVSAHTKKTNVDKATVYGRSRFNEGDKAVLNLPL